MRKNVAAIYAEGGVRPVESSTLSVKDGRRVRLANLRDDVRPSPKVPGDVTTPDTSGLVPGGVVW